VTRPLVFLGPSLSLAEARRICDAEYHPPVARGDLARLLPPDSAPRVVGIVDGVFLHAVAVSPNEILTALRCGHDVYGAASMGALRAVELAPFGMVGVGHVHERFATGIADRDDEVAVAYDAESGRALSDALVSMRVGFVEAVSAGLLDPATAERAVAIASDLHFADRTYRRVTAVLDPPMDLPAARALLEFLRHEATDVKAADARALLRRLADTPWTGLYRPPPPRRRRPHRVTGRAVGDLAPARKRPGWASVRTVDPEFTEMVLLEARAVSGITRVADVTGLDRLGVPCFNAVSPGHTISTFAGKSLEPAQARVGAQMEAFETAVAHDPPIPTRRGPRTDLPGRALDVDGQRDLDWVEGWDVATGDTVWVPVDRVWFRHGADPPWRRDSNGLASGNCLAEALAHGLAEVIERDAATLQALACDYAATPHLLALVAKPDPTATAPPGFEAAPELAYPFVDLASLPGPLGDAVDRITAAGARVDLRWMASDVAVPAFLALIDEPAGGGRAQTHVGFGCHPDSAVAARRAVTEAAQGRVGYIQGGREDLVLAGIREQAEPTGGWFGAEVQRVPFESFPSSARADAVDDIRMMLEALALAGMSEVVAVDLSHPDVPLPVVKVIVTGAEGPLDLWSARRGDFGWRARRLIASMVARSGRPRTPVVA